MNFRLQMVDIQTINVDPAYQRGLNESRVRGIAKNFDVGAVKALSLSQRVDGSLWAYDGRHTLEVLSLKGYKKAPAMIIDGTQEDEARWFILMNGAGTRKASKAEAYIAGLAANDETAIRAREVLNSFGLSLAKGGVSAGKTSSIAFIQSALKSNPERLEAAMQMLHNLWPNEAETWTRIMLRGAWEIVGADLRAQFEAGARLHKVTPRRVLDMAQGMQAANGEPGSGAGHVKRAMLQLARVTA